MDSLAARVAEYKAQRAAQAAALEHRRRSAMASQWVTDILKPSPATAYSTKGPPMTVLVDGDMIAYRSAAATNGTFYRVKMESTKYYKDALKIALKYIEPSGDFRADEAKAKAMVIKDKSPEPISHAIHNMKNMLEGARESIEKRYGRPVEFEVFLTSDVLFRDDISSKYKKSREGVERPVNLKGCKEWLERSHGAQTVPGYEADDLIAMYATDLGPTDCVIMSIDKDLKQLPGDHYDFTKDRYETIDAHTARQNFWTQTLVGDSTDDIPGIKGVGPKTAKKILAHLGPEDMDLQYYKTVLQAWVDRTPREENESDHEFYSRIIKLLSKSCKMLWLCREPEAVWEPPVATVARDTDEASDSQ